MKGSYRKYLAAMLSLILVFIAACNRPVPGPTSEDTDLSNSTSSATSNETTSSTTELTSTTTEETSEATTVEENTTTSTVEDTSVLASTTTESTTTEATTVEETTTTTTVVEGAKTPAQTETKPVEYFSNALFVGDSRLQSLMMYGTLTTPDYIVGRGFNLLNYFSDMTPINGTEQIPATFVANNAGNYTDIYINMGLNELGYQDGPFINTYVRVLEHLKSNNPDATIYINSVLPITEKQDEINSSRNNWITMANVNRINGLLESIAEDYDVYYLDATEVVAPSGYLSEGISADGVHFDRSTVNIWQEFIQSHVVPR